MWFLLPPQFFNWWQYLRCLSTIKIAKSETLKGSAFEMNTKSRSLKLLRIKSLVEEILGGCHPRCLLPAHGIAWKLHRRNPFLYSWVWNIWKENFACWSKEPVSIFHFIHSIRAQWEKKEQKQEENKGKGGKNDPNNERIQWTCYIMTYKVDIRESLTSCRQLWMSVLVPINPWLYHYLERDRVKNNVLFNKCKKRERERESICLRESLPLF